MVFASPSQSLGHLASWNAPTTPGNTPRQMALGIRFKLRLLPARFLELAPTTLRSTFPPRLFSSNAEGPGPKAAAKKPPLEILTNK
jgi:hypothetical protein